MGSVDSQGGPGDSMDPREGSVVTWGVSVDLWGDSGGSVDPWGVLLFCEDTL